MRVLCFLSVSSHESYTGGERQFVEICKVWRRLGNEVHVITDASTVMFCKRFGLTATFHVFRKPQLRIFGLEDFVMVMRMLKAVPSIKFDFIYCPEEKFPHVLASVILKKKTKIPVVCNINLLGPEDTTIASSLKQVFTYLEARNGILYLKAIPGRLFFFTKKMLRNFLFLRKMDVVFSVSPYIKKLLVKLGVDEQRIFVITVGVDRPFVQRIVAKASSSKKFDACFLGSIIPRKGVIDLIKAWKIVVAKKPDARLLIIGKGSGPYFEKVNSLIKNYKLQENVIFSGFVSEEEKYKLLSQSKIFVFPSYLEGNPIAMCEAVSCGVPVIAYDLPYYKETYGDMIVYVSKGDIKQLAVTILNLLDDEVLVEKLKDKYAMLSKRFDWGRIAEYELHVIQKCLFNL
ncbi:MAG: glycosyltransferase family 4 protein [Candidatus Bathyarchaeia archaeon]